MGGRLNGEHGLTAPLSCQCIADRTVKILPSNGWEIGCAIITSRLRCLAIHCAISPDVPLSGHFFGILFVIPAQRLSRPTRGYVQGGNQDENQERAFPPNNGGNTMADDTTAEDARTDDRDSMDTGDGTEPVTRHDVAEGSILGAIGGAVVGRLAGGPIGAMIGAVLGGVASAGAMEVVDKHDHDYAGAPQGDAGTLHDDAVEGDAPLPLPEPSQPCPPWAHPSRCRLTGSLRSGSEPTRSTTSVGMVTVRTLKIGLRRSARSCKADRGMGDRSARIVCGSRLALNPSQ